MLYIKKIKIINILDLIKDDLEDEIIILENKIQNCTNSELADRLSNRLEILREWSEKKSPVKKKKEANLHLNKFIGLASYDVMMNKTYKKLALGKINREKVRQSTLQKSLIIPNPTTK